MAAATFLSHLSIGDSRIRFTGCTLAALPGEIPI
jgi:hypothetical protein